ncbi:MAG: electron transporter SenC [Candidatus Binatia bacterium]|nr:MAG: electron transporter SenC [Candidatus Binatia bacterium]
MRFAFVLLLGILATAARAEDSLLSRVDVESRLGRPVPLDAEFLDETGRRVRLGDLFEGKPLLLVPVYYRCPMLCGLVSREVAKTLAVLGLEAGRDFGVVFFSFDPSETPEQARKKKDEVLSFARSAGSPDGWKFLVGDRNAVERLTEAIGFRYAYDAARGEYAHAAVVLVLTPQGRVSRYFFGVEFPPKDLRLALVEASGGAIGTFVDSVLLYCYRYDPSTGRYSLVVLRSLRAAALGTLAVLGVFLVRAWRREREPGGRGASG